MLTLLASIALSLITSFIGSLCAFVIAQHYHLEDHWSERKATLELERQRKKLAKMSEEERLNLEGRDLMSDA
jgi:hypothetical protein